MTTSKEEKKTLEELFPPSQFLVHLNTLGLQHLLLCIINHGVSTFAQTPWLLTSLLDPFLFIRRLSRNTRARPLSPPIYFLLQVSLLIKPKARNSFF